MTMAVTDRRNPFNLARSNGQKDKWACRFGRLEANAKYLTTLVFLYPSPAWPVLTHHHLVIREWRRRAPQSTERWYHHHHHTGRPSGRAISKVEAKLVWSRDLDLFCLSRHDQGHWVDLTFFSLHDFLIGWIAHTGRFSVSFYSRPHISTIGWNLSLSNSSTKHPTVERLYLPYKTNPECIDRSKGRRTFSRALDTSGTKSR